MSIGRLLLSFALLFTSNVLFASKQAHLQYLPNVPVHLHSTLAIDISQSLPGLSLSTKGEQNIDAEMTLFHENAEMPLTTPPFSLNFVLKNIDINLQANDEDLIFNSGEMGASLYLNQLSKLVDRTIQLNFNESFSLDQYNEQLHRAVTELPVLTEVNPDHLLVELFLHLFAAGGQKLEVGQVIEKDLGAWSIPSLPQKIIYTITQIDDYNVYADITGDIEKQKFELDGQVVLGESSESIGASLSGALKGRVKWNRDNAMLYELNLEYAYVSRVQLAKWEWLMNINLDLHNRTKLQ